MALKKNKKGQMEATDQYGKLGEDYSGITKVSVRPEGAPASQNIDVTKTSPEDRAIIARANANIAKQIEAQKLMDVQNAIGGTQQPPQPTVKPTTSASVSEMQAQQRAQEDQIMQQSQEQAEADFARASAESNLNPSVPQGTIGQIIDKTPVLGPIAETLGTVFRGKRDFIGSEPRTLATADLTNIEYQIVNEGVDNNIKFGAIIESLPVVGSLVNKYARGLINTPSGQIDDLSAQLTPLRKQVVNYQAMAKLSPMLKEQVLKNIEEIELQIQAIESKIRLTANYSAEARANPEKLDLIELNLKNTRLALAKSKYNIINGIDESAIMNAQEQVTQ